MEVPGTARKKQKRTRAFSVATACRAWLVASCVVVNGLAATQLVGCNLENPGLDPPAGVLRYPIALAISNNNDVLYVVNSNFDLKYNAGSVQAYDLKALADRLRKVEKCDQEGVPEGSPTDLPEPSLPDAGADAGDLDSGTDAGLDAGMDAGLDAGMDAGIDASLPDGGELDASIADAGFEATLIEAGVEFPEGYEGASKYGTLRGVLCDGRDPTGKQCCFDDNAQFLLAGDGNEVLIDSYATGIARAPDGSRLYVPLRARDKLLYLQSDTNTGALSCPGSDGRCTTGTDPNTADRDPDVAYPAQPQALTVGWLRDLITEGRDPVTDELEKKPLPDKSSFDSVFIATVHDNGDVALLVDDPANGKGPELHSAVEGFAPFGSVVQLNPTEHLLYTSSSSLSISYISRWGVVLDPTGDPQRWRLYPSSTIGLQLAGGGDVRDLRMDAEDPMRFYALMRGRVESVLFVERDPSSPFEGLVTSATRVGAGPSKLTQATLGKRRLLFVSCFDARAIFVIDEVSRELVSVIRGLAGPFDMQIDTERKLLYVADFRASVVRVVDVKGLVDARLPPPRIIATLGKPTFGGKLE